MYHVFFDESGNSGYLDFIKKSDDFNFLGEPYFTLCGTFIDTDAMEILESDINCFFNSESLSDEIKSEDLYYNNPNLLISIYKRCSYYFKSYIELVDKRYLICTAIVECGLTKGVSCEYNAFRKSTATILHQSLEDVTLKKWIIAQKYKSIDMLREFYIAMGCDLERCGRQEISDAFLEEFKEIEDSYFSESKQIEFSSFSEAYIPDKNRKIISPHTLSFPNIICRAEEVPIEKITHDESTEMKPVIENIFDTLKKLSSDDIIHLSSLNPAGNYHIESGAEIEFLKSHESRFIQLSDLIAGTVMRYFRDRDTGHREDISCQYAELISQLCKYGLINLVVPVDKLENWRKSAVLTM